MRRDEAQFPRRGLRGLDWGPLSRKRTGMPARDRYLTGRRAGGPQKRSPGSGSGSGSGSHWPRAGTWLAVLAGCQSATSHGPQDYRALGVPGAHVVLIWLLSGHFAALTVVLASGGHEEATRGVMVCSRVWSSVARCASAISTGWRGGWHPGRRLGGARARRLLFFLSRPSTERRTERERFCVVLLRNAHARREENRIKAFRVLAGRAGQPAARAGADQRTAIGCRHAGGGLRPEANTGRDLVHEAIPDEGRPEGNPDPWRWALHAGSGAECRVQNHSTDT